MTFFHQRKRLLGLQTGFTQILNVIILVNILSSYDIQSAKNNSLIIASFTPECSQVFHLDSIESMLAAIDITYQESCFNLMIIIKSVI